MSRDNKEISFLVDIMNLLLCTSLCFAFALVKVLILYSITHQPLNLPLIIICIVDVILQTK